MSDMSSGRTPPNRRARAMRWAMRAAYQSAPALRVIVIASIAVAWFVMCAWGALRIEGAQGIESPWLLLGDIIYAPASFLAPETEYVIGSHLVWQWQVGRIFGVLLPAVSILWSLKRRMLEAVAHALVKLGAAGQVVILGQGADARALALATSEAGTPTLFAGEVPDPAELGRAGILVLTAAERDHQLGGTARLGALVAWADNDAAALDQAMEALGAGGGGLGEIAVGIRTQQAGWAMRHAPLLLETGKVKLRPLNPLRTAAQANFATPLLVERAIVAGHERAALRLWGNGELLPWAAETHLKQAWSIGLAGPSVAVDPQAMNTSLWQAWFALIAPLTGGAAVFDKGQAPSAGTAATGAGPGDYIHHLVMAEDDAATLAQVAFLARELRAGGYPEVRVQGVFREAGNLARLFASWQLPVDPPILLGTPPSALTMLDRAGDRRAAELHLAYLAGQDPTADAAIGWHELAETYIEANRAAADHEAIKASDAMRARTAGMDAAALEEALAQVEHRRWSTERLISGWRNGARDNARDLHDKLVPWDQLAEADRTKDRKLAREAIDRLAAAAS